MLHRTSGARGTQWGVSPSSYDLEDCDFYIYQYSNANPQRSRLPPDAPAYDWPIHIVAGDADGGGR